MLEPFRQFTTCPRCGAPGPRDPSLNPFRCASCGFVLYFNAASAVAGFIVRGDGRVLYTRRAKDPAKGKLGMPGGFVDFGETAEEAFAREVREEVGLELDAIAYLASFPNRYAYAGVTYNTLDLFFVAATLNADRATALDAVERLCWLDPALVDPEEIAFESMRRAREVFLRRAR